MNICSPGAWEKKKQQQPKSLVEMQLLHLLPKKTQTKTKAPPHSSPEDTKNDEEQNLQCKKQDSYMMIEMMNMLTTPVYTAAANGNNDVHVFRTKTCANASY